MVRLGFQMMPQGGAYWAPALIVLGAGAGLYGAISALRQTDMKLLMGFSSVSHMGYVFLGLEEKSGFRCAKIRAELTMTQTFPTDALPVELRPAALVGEIERLNDEVCVCGLPVCA